MSQEIKRQEAPKSPHGLSPLEMVSANSLVIHHKNKFLDKVVKVLAGLLALSLVSNAILATRESKNYFFATTPTGQITKIEPMDRPMLTTAQVASFAVEAVTETLSVDFTNYERQLSGSQEYYRPDSFKIILDELRNSGFLKTVTTGKFVATAIPTEAPLVPREGKKNGVYAWEVTFPVSVKLSSVEGTRNQSFNARVIVERAPADIRPRSIAVSKMDLFNR